MTKLRITSFAVLLCAAALSACGENAVQDINGPIATARVKFFNFGVNAPGVNFYAGSQKMTAISSTTGVEAVTGTAYGAVGLGGFYSSIAPGQYAMTGKIAAAVDKDLVVSTINTTIADGKAYSVYLSGFYDATAKTVEGFVVEDAYPAAIDYTVAYVRFVNAISNSTPQTLYAKNQTTGIEGAVGAAVEYKSGGTFVAFPQGVYDLGARTAGSTTNAISLTSASFLAGRVYTVTSRGDMTVVSTTLANRPILSSTANR